ncbi:unnamed protein product [Symbiodinium natans]|uniref:J domain-containing protein n=1 Tax=Symbiodinium natans TaxID=878477 RepID=A0A812JGZ7_9DINO|nr:unnamed protein product [Symbiodinium natans]
MQNQPASYEPWRKGIQPGSNLLALRAPAVMVFGADYCGPCKVLLDRLRRLRLLGPEGATYVDAEDLAPGGGAELLNAVLAGAPFSPPLPVLAVLGPAGLTRLEAGQELLALADDELIALCSSSDSSARSDGCPVAVDAMTFPEWRVYWVKAHVASVTSPGTLSTVSLPSSCVSSPVISHRTIAPVPLQRLQCTRLFSQPSTTSLPAFEPIRQVSAPCAVPNPFPRTPRVEVREPFQPTPRVTIATRLASVDSPRNTIVAPPASQQGVATPPVEAHLPLKIRIAPTPQKASQTPRTPQASYRAGSGWVTPADPLSSTTPGSKGISVMQKRRELLKLKAQEMRAVERQLRQAEAERRHAEAERVRYEAERQRATLRQRSEEAQRRQQEQRESLAFELRRLAEAKRQVRREEAKEVERKRADAQKARQEAAARRTQGKLLVVEEKHRLAEEARRVSEECRKKRLSLGSDSGQAKSPRSENLRGGRRSEILDARRRAVLERGLTHRRAKSADAAQEREAEQRKAEQEKERLEKEEAERRRLRLEQQKRRAEESKQRIQEAGGAWHAVLGLAATATLQEVKQAFRDLALLHHPDKGFQNCDDTFRTVRLAYQQAIASFQEKAKAAGS